MKCSHQPPERTASAHPSRWQGPICSGAEVLKQVGGNVGVQARFVFHKVLVEGLDIVAGGLLGAIPPVQPTPKACAHAALCLRPDSSWWQIRAVMQGAFLLLLRTEASTLANTRASFKVPVAHSSVIGTKSCLSSRADIQMLATNNGPGWPKG